MLETPGKRRQRSTSSASVSLDGSPSRLSPDIEVEAQPFSRQKQSEVNDLKVIGHRYSYGYRSKALKRLNFESKPLPYWRSSISDLEQIYGTWTKACEDGWLQDAKLAGWAGYHLTRLNEGQNDPFRASAPGKTATPDELRKFLFQSVLKRDVGETSRTQFDENRLQDAMGSPMKASSCYDIYSRAVIPRIGKVKEVTSRKTPRLGGSAATATIQSTFEDSASAMAEQTQAMIDAQEITSSASMNSNQPYRPVLMSGEDESAGVRLLSSVSTSIDHAIDRDNYSRLHFVVDGWDEEDYLQDETTTFRISEYDKSQFSELQSAMHQAELSKINSRLKRKNPLAASRHSRPLTVESDRDDKIRQYILTTLGTSPWSLMLSNQQGLLALGFGNNDPWFTSLQNIKSPQKEAATAAILFLAGLARAGHPCFEILALLLSYIRLGEDDGDLTKHLVYIRSVMAEDDLNMDWDSQLKKSCQQLVELLCNPHFTARWGLDFAIPTLNSRDRKATLETTVLSERSPQYEIWNYLTSKTTTLQQFPKFCKTGKGIRPIWYPVSFSLDPKLPPFGIYGYGVHWRSALRIGLTDLSSLIFGLPMLHYEISNERTIPVLFPCTWRDVVWLDYLHTVMRCGLPCPVSSSAKEEQILTAILQASRIVSPYNTSRYVYIAPREPLEVLGPDKIQ